MWAWDDMVRRGLKRAGRDGVGHHQPESRFRRLISASSDPDVRADPDGDGKPDARCGGDVLAGRLSFGIRQSGWPDAGGVQRDERHHTLAVRVRVPSTREVKGPPSRGRRPQLAMPWRKTRTAARTERRRSHEMTSLIV